MMEENYKKKPRQLKAIRKWYDQLNDKNCEKSM